MHIDLMLLLIFRDDFSRTIKPGSEVNSAFGNLETIMTLPSRHEDGSRKMIAERKRQDKTLVGTPRGVPGRRDGKDVRLGRWLPTATVEACRAPWNDVQKAKELARAAGRRWKSTAVITTLRAADVPDMPACRRCVYVRTTL